MSSLSRSIKKVKRLFRGAPNYQDSRREGTAERWQLIRPRLGPSRSLLDVGCAGGAFTRLAAEAGLFAVGLEASAGVVQAANRRFTPERSVAFMHHRLTPESIRTLPTFDVVLCLSVHHLWHREYGQEAARQMLRALGDRATHRLFFEPASRQKKYGRTPPAFVDLDEASIVEHNRALLAGIFGSADVVEYLGASACIGSEPFRYLFMVRTDDMKMGGSGRPPSPPTLAPAPAQPGRGSGTP